MTQDEFKNAPVPSENPALAALWHDAQGDWESAHRAVQNETTTESGWVHAYLHRKEGDATNARYWYDRVGKPEFTGSLESEWAELVQALS